MPKPKPQDPEFLVMRGCLRLLGKTRGLINSLPPDAQARVRAYLIARWTAPEPVQTVLPLGESTPDYRLD